MYKNMLKETSKNHLLLCLDSKSTAQLPPRRLQNRLRLRAYPALHCMGCAVFRAATQLARDFLPQQVVRDALKIMLRLVLALPALLLANMLAATEHNAPQQAVPAYTFGAPQDNEGEEQKPVTSHFECYEHTDDIAKAVCLDPAASLLQSQIENRYRLKLANAPLDQQRQIHQDKLRHTHNTRLFCGSDMACTIASLQEQLVYLLDAPLLGKWQLALHSNKPPVTIGVTGYKDGSTYKLHRLQLFDSKGKLAQSINLFTSLRNNAYEIPHPQPEPYLIDVNFDGWQDLVFLAGRASREIRRLYFIYLPDKHQLLSSAALNTLPNPSFLPDYQLISSSWQDGDRFGVDYLVYKDNKLVRDIRAIYIAGVDGQGNVTTTETLYSNRTGRMVEYARRPVTIDQIGRLPNLYTGTQSGQNQ